MVLLSFTHSLYIIIWYAINSVLSRAMQADNGEETKRSTFLKYINFVFFLLPANILRRKYTLDHTQAHTRTTHIYLYVAMRVFILCII